MNSKVRSVANPLARLPEIDDFGVLRVGDAIFYPERERVAAFIDGHHLQAVYRLFDQRPDFANVRAFVHTLGIVNGIFYFTLLDDTDERISIQPLIDWLQYNGYQVTTKLTRFSVNAAGAKQPPRISMKPEIITDMLRMAFKKSVDHIVLFSGDGDFVAPVEAAMREGVKVTLISTMMSTPAPTNDALRRVVSQFIDVALILPITQDRRNVNRESNEVGVPQFRATGATVIDA